MLAAAKFADNRASVLCCSFGNFDERQADLHDTSLGAKHVGDAPARGRRYFNDRLVGFDGNERLIGDDVIAFVDIPGDDLRLFKTFSKVRQRELVHGTRSVGVQLYWHAFRAAVTMRPTEGM